MSDSNPRDQVPKKHRPQNWTLDPPPPPKTRETGTIWQIGVLTAEQSIFWAKNRHFRPFCATPPPPQTLRPPPPPKHRLKLTKTE